MRAIFCMWALFALTNTSNAWIPAQESDLEKSASRSTSEKSQLDLLRSESQKIRDEAPPVTESMGGAMYQGYGGSGYGSPSGYPGGGLGFPDNEQNRTAQEVNNRMLAVLNEVRKLEWNLKEQTASGASVEERNATEKSLREQIQQYFRLDMIQRLNKVDSLKKQIADMEKKLEFRLSKMDELVGSTLQRMVHQVDGLDFNVPLQGTDGYPGGYGGLGGMGGGGMGGMGPGGSSYGGSTYGTGYGAAAGYPALGASSQSVPVPQNIDPSGASMEAGDQKNQ